MLVCEYQRQHLQRQLGSSQASRIGWLAWLGAVEMLEGGGRSEDGGVCDVGRQRVSTTRSVGGGDVEVSQERNYLIESKGSNHERVDEFV